MSKPSEGAKDMPNAKAQKAAEQMQPKGANKGRKYSNSRKKRKRSGGGQPKKDSSDKRVNYDNTREDKVAAIIRKAMTNRGHNDFGWYNGNPELLKSASQVQFYNILGDSIYPNYRIPGLMAINYVPNFGTGAKPYAMNQASDDIYSFIVHANSRDYSATAPDYMIFSGAGMQIFQCIGAMIRAYRTVRLYKEENSYMPKTLLTRMGCDPDDFRKALPRMWFDINELIQRSLQIWIPKVFPLMERWYWLNSNIYLDSAGDRAQMFLFNQVRYYKLSEAGAETGSSLVPVTINSGGTTVEFRPGFGNTIAFIYTWDQWLEAINSMFDALISSEDRGMIYGNLLNAYGKENLYGLSPIQPDEIIVPVYNAEVLTQVENMTTVGDTYAPIGLVQYEEDLYPVFQSAGADVKTVLDQPVLNFHTSELPAEELIVEATRLMAAGAVTDKAISRSKADALADATWNPAPADGVPTLRAAGSELVVGFSISQNPSSAAITALTSSVITSSINVAEILSPFDWHPFIYRVTAGADSMSLPTPTKSGMALDLVSSKIQGVSGDFDNFTTLSANQLARIHSACMFSLWGTPQV